MTLRKKMSLSHYVNMSLYLNIPMSLCPYVHLSLGASLCVSMKISGVTWGITWGILGRHLGCLGASLGVFGRLFCRGVS